MTMPHPLDLSMLVEALNDSFIFVPMNPIVLDRTRRKIDVGDLTL
jgi:hypothetical protein